MFVVILNCGMTTKLLSIGLFLCLLIIPIETFHKRPVIDIRQERCLATIVYWEARGESKKGQLAVAHTVINRALKRKLSICETMRQRKQFSWYSPEKEKIALSRIDKQLALAYDVMQEHDSGRRVDVVAGATHFATRGIVNYWTAKFKHIVTIGKHKFYREINKEKQ